MYILIDGPLTGGTGNEKATRSWIHYVHYVERPIKIAVKIPVTETSIEKDEKRGIAPCAETARCLLLGLAARRG